MIRMLNLPRLETHVLTHPEHGEHLIESLGPLAPDGSPVVMLRALANETRRHHSLLTLSECSESMSWMVGECSLGAFLVERLDDLQKLLSGLPADDLCSKGLRAVRTVSGWEWLNPHLPTFLAATEREARGTSRSSRLVMQWLAEDRAFLSPPPLHPSGFARVQLPPGDGSTLEHGLERAYDRLAAEVGNEIDVRRLAQVHATNHLRSKLAQVTTIGKVLGTDSNRPAAPSVLITLNYGQTSTDVEETVIKSVGRQHCRLAIPLQLSTDEEGKESGPVRTTPRRFPWRVHRAKSATKSTQQATTADYLVEIDLGFEGSPRDLDPITEVKRSRETLQEVADAVSGLKRFLRKRLLIGWYPIGQKIHFKTLKDLSDWLEKHWYHVERPPVRVIDSLLKSYDNLPTSLRESVRGALDRKYDSAAIAFPTRQTRELMLGLYRKIKIDQDKGRLPPGNPTTKNYQDVRRKVCADLRQVTEPEPLRWRFLRLQFCLEPEDRLEVLAGIAPRRSDERIVSSSGRGIIPTRLAESIAQLKHGQRSTIALEWLVVIRREVMRSGTSDICKDGRLRQALLGAALALVSGDLRHASYKSIAEVAEALVEMIEEIDKTLSDPSVRSIDEALEEFVDIAQFIEQLSEHANNPNRVDPVIFGGHAGRDPDELRAPLQKLCSIQPGHKPSRSPYCEPLFRKAVISNLNPYGLKDIQSAVIDLIEKTVECALRKPQQFATWVEARNELSRMKLDSRRAELGASAHDEVVLEQLVKRLCDCDKSRSGVLSICGAIEESRQYINSATELLDGATTALRKRATEAKDFRDTCENLKLFDARHGLAIQFAILRGIEVQAEINKLAFEYIAQLVRTPTGFTPQAPEKDSPVDIALSRFAEFGTRFSPSQVKGIIDLTTRDHAKLSNVDEIALLEQIARLWSYQSPPQSPPQDLMSKFVDAVQKDRVTFTPLVLELLHQWDQQEEGRIKAWERLLRRAAQEVPERLLQESHRNARWRFTRKWREIVRFGMGIASALWLQVDNKNALARTCRLRQQLITDLANLPVRSNLRETSDQHERPWKLWQRWVAETARDTMSDDSCRESEATRGRSDRFGTLAQATKLVGPLPERPWQEALIAACEQPGEVYRLNTSALFATLLEDRLCVMAEGGTEPSASDLDKEQEEKTRRLVQLWSQEHCFVRFDAESLLHRLATARAQPSRLSPLKELPVLSKRFDVFDKFRKYRPSDNFRDHYEDLCRRLLLNTSYKQMPESCDSLHREVRLAIDQLYRSDVMYVGNTSTAGHNFNVVKHFVQGGP